MADSFRTYQAELERIRADARQAELRTAQQEANARNAARNGN